MKVFETRKIDKDIPVKVICNKSGREIQLENDDEWVGRNLIHSFSVNFGYGSDFDMDTWEFDLCEDELLNFLRTLKVRPSGFAADTKYPDQVFEEWKLTGKYNWRAGWTYEEIKDDDITRKESERRFKEKLNQFTNFKRRNT
ncbi:hypothetical protein [Bacillus sp. UMB0728]|uniref:hypothetical protein n=1 Tax=Bacillus sp. UMB0728 TaxID=2066052 RepID=UPI000C7950C3|nr:hypothetical protein [Bacillus sp. UMB0728]PLR72183.1 hypothetical protein CYJ37_11545 [Bacillus sp. UMB0728]